MAAELDPAALAALAAALGVQPDQVATALAGIRTADPVPEEPTDPAYRGIGASGETWAKTADGWVSRLGICPGGWPQLWADFGPLTVPTD